MCRKLKELFDNEVTHSLEKAKSYAKLQNALFAKGFFNIQKLKYHKFLLNMK